MGREQGRETMQVLSDRSGLAAAILYGVCSTSMAFVNKAVMNSYDFNLPFFILACQMLATIGFLEALRSTDTVELPAFSVGVGRTFIVPSTLYALHSALSLMALSGMNIPMYGALKRCTPLVNLVLSVVMLKRARPTPLIIFSILVITGGCLVAGLGDLSFDLYAYTVGTLSVLAQGLYLTMVEQVANKHKYSTTGILQLNAFNTLPLFLCFSLFTGEMDQVLQFRHWTDLGFLLTLLLQVILGSVLNYLLFLCTCLTSALTTSLVGVAKSVIQTVLGFFTFGGVPINLLNLTGIVLNTCGGFIYTYAKMKEKTKEKWKGSDENDNGVTDVLVKKESTAAPNGTNTNH